MHYPEEVDIINGGYFAELSLRVDLKISNKRLHLAKNKILSHQDKARAHISAAAMAKSHEQKHELILHSLYSSDLAPYNFFLFPKFKKSLRDKEFSSNFEMMSTRSVKKIR